MKFIANADCLGQRTLSFMVILLNAYPAGNGIISIVHLYQTKCFYQKCINGLVFLAQHRYQIPVFIVIVIHSFIISVDDNELSDLAYLISLQLCVKKNNVEILQYIITMLLGTFFGNKKIYGISKVAFLASISSVLHSHKNHFSLD